MGLSIDRESFESEDFGRFAERLADNLAALRALLARPGFGVGAASLGAELEVSLVDARGRALPVNREVLSETSDPRFTEELNRFNLECNLLPTAMSGRPFRFLEGEFESALVEARRASGACGARVAAIGILPTLQAPDLQEAAMTDSMRYRALSAALKRLRHEPFRMQIDGDDPLQVTCDGVTFEGANTSLQIHLRVDPGDFIDAFNAAQLATLPVLACAANSPTFLGHRLWDETRIALFKHAVDDRGPARRSRVPRVAFGTRWLTGDAGDFFRECVELHEPLLPMCTGEASLDRAEAGGLPRLDELRLHQGTVWRWNRGIYDPSAGGHLRIEMRALPAGPTPLDMTANAAFLVGLVLGLAVEAPRVTRRFPFEAAHYGFYRAAQHGLEATLAWPDEATGEPRAVIARELVGELLPLAARGLEGAGVAAEESDRLLGVIERRLAASRTGAVWQRVTLDALEPRLHRSEALAEMFDRYLRWTETGAPVHEWEGPAGSW